MSIAPFVYSNHCKDLNGDREIGQYWERQLCVMASEYGKSFTPMQLGRETSITAFAKNGGRWNRYTLPDVVIWTAPGEHHEIKHKNPLGNRTNGPSYGLEVYRFDALLWFARETGQNVMYTIHNHDKAGGREVKENDITHWETANILRLNNKWHTCRRGPSWVNGQKKEVDIYYWSVSLWTPLSMFWKLV